MKINWNQLSFAIKRGKLPVLAILLACGLGLSSCTKDYFDFDSMADPDWTPEFAVPLVDSRIEAQSILDRFDNDSLIAEDGTGLYHLYYYSEIFSLPAEDIITLPDVNLPGGYILDAADANDMNTNGGKTIPLNTVGNFPVNNGEQFTRVDYKGGNMILNVSANSVPYDCQITITFPDLTLAGTPLTLSGTVSGLQTQLNLDAEALNGYTLDLTQGGAGNNEVRANVFLDFSNGTGAIPGQNISFDIEIQNQEYSQIRGDLGQQVITTGLDSIRLRIFQNTTNGTIEYEDPRIRAIFSNSFGASLGIDVQQLRALSDNGNVTTFTTTGSGIGEGTTITIGAPTLANIGSFDTTSIENNVNNSNIQAAFGIAPSFVRYEVNATTNPTGPSTNFVTDQSLLALDMEVDLPLHGRAIDFSKTDTVSWDLPADSTIDSNDVREVLKAEIRLIVDNGFPAEASVQGYFYDSTMNTVLDSLIITPDEQIFASGELTVDRVVIPQGVVRTVRDIVIDREQLLKLRDQKASILVITGAIETSNQGSTPVKIFNDCFMNLKVGLKVELDPLANQ